jgi:hypothetical protein
MLKEVTESNKPYLGIVNGYFSQTVDKDTPKAKLREYELKDGTKGSKWELQFSEWSGIIRDIKFEDGKYGAQCLIDGGDAVICLGVKGKYFADFACKIMSANLNEEVTLHPYNFETDDGKTKTGISVQQNGNKLMSYFYNGKTNINGFPTSKPPTTGVKMYWEGYFLEVAKFLIEQLKTLKFSPPATIEQAEEVFGAKAEEVSRADVMPKDYEEAGPTSSGRGVISKPKIDMNEGIPSDLPWQTDEENGKLPLDK